MRTYVTKPKDIERKWFVVDADGKTLGRLATVVADTLRGKKKACFSPSVDCGDYVIVVNTKKIKVTGNKLEEKKYHSYSGYIGGMKSLTLNEMLERDANKVIYEAVKGMLPKNRLADDIIKKLKLFTGAQHEHEAQKPEKLEVEA
jgi:large subunit ribosomal protein L13